MKKIIVALMTIAFLGNPGSAQQKKLKDMIGRWDISGEQHAGAYLEVIDSLNMFLSYNGEKKKIIDYNINFDKSPIWFDFSTADSSTVVTIKSLLEIVGENMMKWQLFLDEDRTDYFSSTKGELFYLRKATKNTNSGIAGN